MHSKRAIAFTVKCYATWTIFFIVGAFLIGTDALHWIPEIDHRRILSFIIFLAAIMVMSFQTYSTLPLFRAFTSFDREKSRWDALIFCFLGWVVNFWGGSKVAAFGLFGLIGDLPIGED